MARPQMTERDDAKEPKQKTCGRSVQGAARATRGRHARFSERRRLRNMQGRQVNTAACVCVCVRGVAAPGKTKKEERH